MKSSTLTIAILAHLIFNFGNANVINMNSIIEETEILKIPKNTNVTSGSSATFQLGQPWNERPDDNLRPTQIQASWSPLALHIEAILVDDEIFTQATADNQKMWELGDVFEMFLQVEGREDYIELHVTPNNKRLHAHKPNAEGKPSPEADPLPIEKMLINPIGFTSSVTRIPEGWKAIATIPSTILGLDRFISNTQLRVSFCRYDAASDREPTLSTTASHTIIAFHQPHEWSLIALSE